jgi:hypothetical protein
MAFGLRRIEAAMVSSKAAGVIRWYALRLFPARSLTVSKFSSSSLFVRFQFPSREDSGEPVSLVLKNPPQPSAAIRSAVNGVDIVEAALIAGNIVIAEKALLGLFGSMPCRFFT